MLLEAVPGSYSRQLDDIVNTKTVDVQVKLDSTQDGVHVVVPDSNNAFEGP